MRCLRQCAHHEQSTRLLDRLVRGERCTCASLAHQLAEGASREVCGKEAVSLEHGLALKEVDVFLKTLAGATRQIRFVSRGGNAYAILCEATPSAMFCGLRASFFVRAAFRTSPPRFEQGAQTRGVSTYGGVHLFLGPADPP